MSDASVMCREASFGWTVAVWIDMIKEPASGHVLAVTSSYFRKLRIDVERLEFFFHPFRIDEFRNTDFKSSPRLDPRRRHNLRVLTRRATAERLSLAGTS